MNRPLTVDVRDMLCAQALALVAQAVGRLRVGEQARVLWNADDVRRDLLLWARDRGYGAHVEGAVMSIERRAAA